MYVLFDYTVILGVFSESQMNFSSLDLKVKRSEVKFSFQSCECNNPTMMSSHIFKFTIQSRKTHALFSIQELICYINGAGRAMMFARTNSSKVHVIVLCFSNLFFLTYAGFMSHFPSFLHYIMETYEQVIHFHIYSQLYSETSKLNKSIQLWSLTSISAKPICTGTNPHWNKPDINHQSGFFLCLTSGANSLQVIVKRADIWGLHFYIFTFKTS